MKHLILMLMLALGAMLCTSCNDDEIVEPKASTSYATLVVKTGPSYDNHLMQVTNPKGGPAIQFTWDTIPSGQISLTYTICSGCTSTAASVSHTDTTNWGWSTKTFVMKPGETHIYE